MYERFIFVSELERSATRELVHDEFPVARLWDVCDDVDFLMDMDLALDEGVFFRWAVATPGPARWVIYSCFNMSLALHDPPAWMVQEMRRLVGIKQG